MVENLWNYGCWKVLFQKKLLRETDMATGSRGKEKEFCWNITWSNPSDKKELEAETSNANKQKQKLPWHSLDNNEITNNC